MVDDPLTCHGPDPPRTCTHVPSPPLSICRVTWSATRHSLCIDCSAGDSAQLCSAAALERLQRFRCLLISIHLLKCTKYHQQARWQSSYLSRPLSLAHSLPSSLSWQEAVCMCASHHRLSLYVTGIGTRIRHPSSMSTRLCTGTGHLHLLKLLELSTYFVDSRCFT